MVYYNTYEDAKNAMVGDMAIMPTTGENGEIAYIVVPWYDYINNLYSEAEYLVEETSAFDLSLYRDDIDGLASDIMGDYFYPETYAKALAERMLEIYGEKLENIRKELLEMLSENDTLFENVCNEIDSWNGILQDSRCYQMYEIDDLFCDTKPSKLISMIDFNDFNDNNEYFYFDGCGNLCSTNYPVKIYRENVSEEEILEECIEYYNKRNFSWINKEFNEKLEMLYKAEG